AGAVPHAADQGRAGRDGGGARRLRRGGLRALAPRRRARGGGRGRDVAGGDLRRGGGGRRVGMRNLFTVAARELRQRRAVLAGAVLVALAPVVVCSFGPDYRHGARIYGVAEFLASLGLAAFVGLGLIGDDLASGRMGWYFSRPLSGAAIWGGKMGGAAALAIASTWIMTLPALLLVEPREGLFDGFPMGVAGLVVCPVMFLGA